MPYLLPISFYIAMLSRMSLLSSFENDFNRSMAIHSCTITKGTLGQEKKSYQETWIVKGILLPTKESYDNFTTNTKTGNNGIVYDQFEYEFRCELWPKIKKWDFLKDNLGQWYEVKRSYRAPGFWGEDDHLVCCLNESDDFST